MPRLSDRPWEYLLVLTPILTDWLDVGHWPDSPGQWTTEILVGLLIAVGVRRLHVRAERLRRLAETDSLTGLGNRRRFVADLDAALKRVRRGRADLVLAYVDIDHFKQVNDRYGHDHGDAVLVTLAERLRAVVGVGGSCYRVGGDEFAVLVPSSDANDVAGVLGDGVVLPGVTVSFGATQLSGDLTSADVVRHADREMYRAKRERFVS